MGKTILTNFVVRKTGFYQIASWCVFKQSTRTNNDVEGWHRRLNKKTDDEKPPFYLLVRRLYEEAQLLPNFVGDN
jgi:hypothetical protein